MAPVEIDHVPRSIIAPVKNMKVVDKAMSLPLVSSAYTEVTRVTSPYMESTMTRVSPVVEMVSPMVDTVKTKVEEQLVTRIPTGISETVTSYQAKAVDQVIAAVEKVDGFACSGIDQLTEKVPQLKDATPKLIEETKSSVTTFVTGWSEYFASFSVALVTLKVVDATLDKVETILKATECDTAKTMSDYVKTIHDTANTLRLGAVKRAGTPLAKKIEEGTIPESLMEVSGLQSVMERLGLVGGEVPETKEDATAEEAKVPEVEKVTTEEAKVSVPEAEKVVTEEAKVPEVVKDTTEEVKVPEAEKVVTEEDKVPVVVKDTTEEDTKVVETATEAIVATDAVSKKSSSKKSKKGSKESTPVLDL